MPRAYSTDLRQRVLVACERAVAHRAEIARRYQVSEATVYNWPWQAREEGRRQAKPHSGGSPPRLDAPALAVLRKLVIECNDATLAEHGERLAERTGQRVSPPVLCRTLKSLKLTRKKRRFGPPSRTAMRSPPSATSTGSE